MDIAKYSIEFMTIAIAHLVAVASPGPDFAVVMKHSITYGKRVALLTSLGVGCAIFLHVAYAVAGIGIIINSTAWLYDMLVLVAACFLLYIGNGAIRSQPHAVGLDNKEQEFTELSDKKAFFIGFLTNGLNPKATLFFLSLFTVVVDVNTPTYIKGLYGTYMALATFIWFSLLSLLLTRNSVRALFSKNAHIFDRIMGWVLILLALNILYTELLSKYLM